MWFAEWPQFPEPKQIGQSINQFWPFTSKDSNPNLRRFGLVPMLGSTYLCESAFSPWRRLNQKGIFWIKRLLDRLTLILKLPPETQPHLSHWRLKLSRLYRTCFYEWIWPSSLPSFRSYVLIMNKKIINIYVTLNGGR